MSHSLSRRALVRGLGAALPLATVLADPRLARAAAGSLAPVTIPTPGGRTVQGSVAQPATTPAPAVMLIHEWWGLNDQIKAVAAELAQLGYLALAIDLYDGKVASTPEDAGRLMKAVDPAVALDQLTAGIDWLRQDARCSGKVGTVGWCFGGGWSLRASTAAPVEATVVYYGDVTVPTTQLAQLQGPVIGHFATRDQWINKAMVDGFQRAMDEAGKSLTVYWYDADHAFANPTGARYDAKDAQLAWERTQAFFHANLG
jgi:Dienelactone hydrolase and related enzymes